MSCRRTVTFQLQRWILRHQNSQLCHKPRCTKPHIALVISLLRVQLLIRMLIVTTTTAEKKIRQLRLRLLAVKQTFIIVDLSRLVLFYSWYQICQLCWRMLHKHNPGHGRRNLRSKVKVIGNENFQIIFCKYLCKVDRQTKTKMIHGPSYTYCWIDFTSASFFTICLCICHLPHISCEKVYTLCSEKNTHSHFLSYLHEWCVDLNKNCSENTRGKVDSDNVEIRYLLWPMT